MSSLIPVTWADLLQEVNHIRISVRIKAQGITHASVASKVLLGNSWHSMLAHLMHTWILCHHGSFTCWPTHALLRWRLGKLGPRIVPNAAFQDFSHSHFLTAHFCSLWFFFHSLFCSLVGNQKNIALFEAPQFQEVSIVSCPCMRWPNSTQLPAQEHQCTRWCSTPAWDDLTPVWDDNKLHLEQHQCTRVPRH